MNVQPPPLDGSLVTGVVFVDRITRPKRGDFQSVSLPGHLIHLVVAGRVEQRAGGVGQEIAAGDAVWYHENEEVHGRIHQAPWTFYTVNFFAPTIIPPPLHERVCRASPSLVQCMESLLETWRDTTAPRTARHLRVHALLLEVIGELLPRAHLHYRADSAAQLWWQIESEIRRDLSRVIDMRLLKQAAGCAERTIIRACQLAVGSSPMKRVKDIRLNYARGLVQLSQVSMTEIGLRVGYGRVQEFSRDYHRHFGITPTEDRKRGPDYRRIRPASPSIR